MRRHFLRFMFLFSISMSLSFALSGDGIGGLIQAGFATVWMAFLVIERRLES